MKNKKIYIILFLILSCSVVFADTINYENLCANYNEGIGSAVRIIGYLIEIVKWIVPLIIIVLGMIDFGKAIISSDEKAISQAASTLTRRIVAGVVIFFIFTIILAFINLIDISKDLKKQHDLKLVQNVFLMSKHCPM